MAEEKTFEGLGRATGIGSLPFIDVEEAIDKVLEFCPDLPYWPQLPRLSSDEGMVRQVAEGLPGAKQEEERLSIVQDDRFFENVEELFQAYAAGDEAWGNLSPDRAVAFDGFVEAVEASSISQAKGQVCGPITFGMNIHDDGGKPILYDPLLLDVLTKHLWCKVRWQASRMEEAGCLPVIFVDEPSLATYGTPFFGWSIEQIRALLEQIYTAAPVAGTHCCSNTDWGIFLESSVDVISFDAHQFSENFLAYSEQATRFIDRGGNIAWGIVPTDPEALANVREEDLCRKLAGMFRKLESAGAPRERILDQSLITPACGLGTRERYR